MSTCQICGRDIKAKSGKIAHHGYTRPGMGWQTGSCEGARHQPLELSCATLVQHIQHIDTAWQTAVKYAALAINRVTVNVAYTRAFSKSTYETADVTADTFEQVKAAHAHYWATANYTLQTFADCVKRERSERKSQAQRLATYLTMQRERLADAQARYDYKSLDSLVAL